MSEAKLRYRFEDGVPCIDVGVQSVDRLLDQRDPAPFRDRDLDPGLVEYLTEAAEELARHAELRVVFWIQDAAPAQEIEDAYRAHFADTVRRVDRRHRQRTRVGISALAIGVVLLVLLLSLSRLIRASLPEPLGPALAEGLVILSWIALWRPVDVLLFDWIPVRQERAVLRRLSRARVEVRCGASPEHPVPTRTGRARDCTGLI